MYVDRKLTAYHLPIALLFINVSSSAAVQIYETDNTLLVASPLPQFSLKSYLHPPPVKAGLVVLLYVKANTPFPGLLTSSHPPHPHLAYRCPYSFISGSGALLVLASCLGSVLLQFRPPCSAPSISSPSCCYIPQLSKVQSVTTVPGNRKMSRLRSTLVLTSLSVPADSLVSTTVLPNSAPLMDLPVPHARDPCQGPGVLRANTSHQLQHRVHIPLLRAIT